MLRVVALLAAIFSLNVEQALAGQVIARDGQVYLAARGEDWCGPTAKLEIIAPDSATFSPNNLQLQTFAGVLQSALTFECPVARAVDIWGKVDGKTLYRGSAGASEGWRLRAGSAASNALGVGPGGVQANQDGLVPTHWRGEVTVKVERVTENRISRSQEKVFAGFYPQPDGRIRGRVGKCEGEIVMVNQGRALRGAPALGPEERLYRFVAPSSPFTVPTDVAPLEGCGFVSANDAAWLVIRTAADNGLAVRMTNRTFDQGGRRESVIVEQVVGNIPAIYPPKPRRVSELRQYVESGNGSATATNLLLGLVVVGLMAAMMPGSGGGGGGGHGGSSGHVEHIEINQYRPPPPPPPAPWPPSPLGW